MLTPVVPPPPVVAGDYVGVAALSGPVDPTRLEAGLDGLRRLGFEPVVAANVKARHGLFAGSEQERLAGLYSLTDDPAIKAVFFARGGWGFNRLIEKIDWSRVGRYPRAYIGYSDLTPFLQGIVEHVGVASFHGPMVAAELARGLTADERESLLASLAGDFPRSLEVAWAEEASEAEGILLGGCLSLVVSLLGTPWQLDLEDSLFFIEDLNEPPYRFDRMLTHLRLSGTLAGIKGLIVGHLHAEGKTEPTAFDGEVTLESLLRSLAVDFHWPLATGLSAGHACPSLTLPFGMRARLEPQSRKLVVGI